MLDKDFVINVSLGILSFWFLVEVAMWFIEAAKRKVILDAMLDNEYYILLHRSRDRYVEIAERMTDQRDDADSENVRLQGLLYEATKEQPKTAQEFLDNNPQLKFKRGYLEFIAAQELEDSQVAALKEKNRVKALKHAKLYGVGHNTENKLSGIDGAFDEVCDCYTCSL
jgi:hypothetical protein